jgi:tRNA(Met) C34 N-acetyltransferase TmcA
MSLKLNVMADQDFRKQLLDLLRDQVRPLADQLRNEDLKQAVEERVTKSLAHVDVRQMVRDEIRAMVGATIAQQVTPAALRDLVKDMTQNRVDVLLVDELRQIIKPLVLDALKTAVQELIKK